MAARIEHLRRSRAAGPGGARRRHLAFRSRVAVAGLGIGATLGLVGAMELSGMPAAASADGGVVVVVHHRGDGAPSSGPVALAANPVVRVVPAPTGNSAPVARTHGSR